MMETLLDPPLAGNVFIETFFVDFNCSSQKNLVELWPFLFSPYMTSQHPYSPPMLPDPSSRGDRFSVFLLNSSLNSLFNEAAFSLVVLLLGTVCS